MTESPNLVLPYILAAQAQKHVTHNEAIRALDAVVHLSAFDKDLGAPPGATPPDGARYIVAAGASGAWAGQTGKVAAWQDGAWIFRTPREGWLAWVADEDKLYVFDGAAWVLVSTGGGGGPAGTAPNGFQNRLKNGSMRINQRLVTTAGDGVYCFDRWYALTQTAAIGIGAQTDIADGWPYAIRLTQTQASAQRMGLGQLLEKGDIADLRNRQVTLSAKVRASAGATVRYALLAWTGTADAPTKDWVNDWTSATFTAGNFFKSTSTTVVATGSTVLTANTVASITALTGTIPSGANNVGVMFWTDATFAQNATLDIGNVQLEPGATATSFDMLPFHVELTSCLRYLEKSYPLSVTPGTVTTAGQAAVSCNSGSVTVIMPTRFKVEKFASPTMTAYNPNTGTVGQYYDASSGGNFTISSVFGLGVNGFTGLTATAGNTDGNTCAVRYVVEAELGV